jgi:hypothetical protein
VSIVRAGLTAAGSVERKSSVPRKTQDRRISGLVRAALVVSIVLLSFHAVRPPVAGGDGEFQSFSAPPGGGFAVAIWGYGEANDLVDAAAAGGCVLAAAWVTAANGFVGYVPGAPPTVNQPFLALFPGGAIPSETPLLLSCAATSAGGTVQPRPPFPTPPAIPGPGASLLRHVTYELGSELSETLQTETSYGLQAVGGAARLGGLGGEALLRPGDPSFRGDLGFRSEWQSTFRASRDIEYWYGVSVNLPADWDQGSNRGTFDDRIIFQFHEGTGGEPAFSLHINEDANRIALRRKIGEREFDYRWSTAIETNRWYDFAFVARWTRTSAGYFHVYLDGRLVHRYSGPTLVDGSIIYTKWGIYGQPARVLFDEVWIARPN